MGEKDQHVLPSFPGGKNTISMHIELVCKSPMFVNSITRVKLHLAWPSNKGHGHVWKGYYRVIRVGEGQGGVHSPLLTHTTKHPPKRH